MYVVSPKIPSFLNHKNVIHVGPQSFATVKQLMLKSKIVINVLSKFSRGSHERLWYSMAAGCAVAADQSLYLERYFVDKQSILTIPWGSDQRQFQDELRQSINRPTILESIVHNNAPIYRNNHTWHQRVVPLVELLRQFTS